MVGQGEHGAVRVLVEALSAAGSEAFGWHMGGHYHSMASMAAHSGRGGGSGSALDVDVGWLSLPLVVVVLVDLGVWRRIPVC